MFLLLLLCHSAFSQSPCLPELCNSPTCILQDETFNCSSSLQLTATQSISLQNVTLICFQVTETLPNCSVNIRAGEVEILNSVIYASGIFIAAEGSIDIGDSVLSANGTGEYNGPGVCLDKGGSYGGRGGGSCRLTCGPVTYGSVTIPLDYGSGSSPLSRGGGIIWLSAPSISLSGELSSSGDLNITSPYLNPLSQSITPDTPGGSGGSILINATEILSYSANPILITVAGGAGGNESYSGGGGRIAIYGSVPAMTVITMGVQSSDLTRPCATGGSGTYYNDFLQTVYIDNHGCKSENLTPVQVEGNFSLQVSNGAMVSPFYIEDVLSAASITVEAGIIDASWDHDPNNAVSITQLLIIAESIQVANTATIGSFNDQLIEITTTRLSIDTSSGIEFGGEFVLRANNLMLEGEIEGDVEAPDPTMLLVYADSFYMLSEAGMKASLIGVMVTSTFFLQGSIQTPGSACTGLPELNSSAPYSCLQSNGTIDLDPDITSLLGSNYTLYLFALTSITISQNAKVIGPRVGLCSADLSIAGTISTIGYGCAGNSGLGKGAAVAGKCTASGGGYGGVGGSGTSIQGANCTGILAGLTYGLPNETWHEGSGGGGVTAVPGAGGGCIILQAAQTLSLNGSVISNGEDAPPTTEPEGAGGGAGGSILIQSQFLAGDGLISANGGTGMGPGSGGGGGRVLFNWSTDVKISDPEAAYQWTGSVFVTGGSATKGDNGNTGTLNSASCSPGYSGYLCSPCPSGTYKSSSSFGEPCVPCTNKPNSGSYTGTAIQSNTCPYICPSWFTGESDNKYCDSPMSMFFDLFGGVWLAVGALGGIAIGITVFVSGGYIYRLRRKQRNPEFDFAQTAGLKSHSELLERKMQLAKAEHPEMTREALPFHSLRVYFLGDNTYFKPWGLPPTVVPELEGEVQDKEYADFAVRINRLVRWYIWEQVILSILQVIYPPLELPWLHFRRKNKFRKVRKFVQFYPENLWKKVELRQLSNSLRISCSFDFTLAALDITCPLRRVEEWDEQPHLPMKLLATGYGTFDFPYHFPASDIMVQFLSFAVKTENRNQFFRFLSRLNAIAREVTSEKPICELEIFEHIENLTRAFNTKWLSECDYQLVPCAFQGILYVKSGAYAPNLYTDKRYNRPLRSNKDQPKVEVSFKLGLVLAQISSAKDSSAFDRTRLEGYWEPVALTESSEALLEENGFALCKEVSESKARKCSLDGLLLGAGKPYWMFWLILLVFGTTVDLGVTIVLVIDFATLQEFSGLILYLSLVPLASVVSPILMLSVLSSPSLIRHAVKFEIGSVYNTLAMLVFTAVGERSYTWTLVMGVVLLLKLTIVKLAAVHTACLSQLHPLIDPRKTSLLG